MLYIIPIAVILYCVIRFAANKRKITLPIAFAGVPHDNQTSVVVPVDRNDAIYTEGETVVDMSKKTAYLIKGNSLEKEGLKDGSLVYVDKVNDYDTIAGYFVILKIDNKRISTEHPDHTDYVEGFKARKAKTLFPIGMSKADFGKRMSEIDSLDSGKIEKLWVKYDFAQDYYKEEDRLLVSVTYRNGVTKDYSFHSLSNVVGVVTYLDETN